MKKLTAKLAYSQLLQNRRRTIWTLIGIMLSAAMITAIYGFAASALAVIVEFRGGDAGFLNTYSTMFIGIGVVLSGIVALASIVVVSNSFRVSAAERARQFGILKSVGATKQQITQTVMYEALILSIVGIPLGILFGLLVQFVALQIAAFLLMDLNRINPDNPLIFSFVVAWQAILASVLMAYATIMLSAWLPARKAAKIPAIDAIRGAGEVKLKARQVRSSFIVKKLFGIEGRLASKSLKRNKRNLRATVVSLSVSIVLFIAATSVGTQMITATNMRFVGSNADVIGSFFSSHITDPETGKRRALLLDNSQAEAVAVRLREFQDTDVMFLGANTGNFMADIPAEDILPAALPFFHVEDGVSQTHIAILVVDADTYARLCEIAGVSHGSNILINHFRTFDWERERQIALTPLVFRGQTIINRRNTDAIDEITLHGEIRELPGDLMWLSRFSIGVVVPEASASDFQWFATTADPDAFEKYALAVFDEMLTPLVDEWDLHARTGITNLAATVAAERGIVRLLMVFIYGFVAMLTLIGLTNVISTISTNVRSRSQEFAILQSVGMTHKGICRMLNFESILCSAKSLIIGIPLGIGASYLTYRAVQGSFGFEYNFPWLAVAVCIAGVFAITYAIMRFASRLAHGDSIIETIRRGSEI